MTTHSHDHGHHHAPRTFNKAFAIAVSANSIFVVAQVFMAWMANSTSLMADALHNAGDVVSLILAWVAMGLMKRSPTAQSSYGLKKVSILAALANGLLLTFTCGIIVSEAISKFMHPEPIAVWYVVIVATAGIIVNGATAALFMKDNNDLNIRGAFLHLFYDALISAGVVISAILLYFTGWLWVDPLVGLLIALIILRGTWSLFTDSLRLIIDAVPRTLSFADIQQFLLDQKGVKSLHDLHVWALSTQENALSVHLYMPEKPLTDEERFNLVCALKKQFALHHITIQIESQLNTCDDACGIG